MIFLKAIVFACVVCFLGNLIICLVWKELSSLTFQFLPFLLAFFSLLILFVAKILPYYPVWFLLPIGMQVLLVEITNSFFQNKIDFLNGKIFYQKNDHYILETELEEENPLETILQTEDKTSDISSKKEEGVVLESENDVLISRNSEEMICSDLNSQENVNTTEASSENNSCNDTSEKGEDNTYEILFLQADIFFVQGDVEENKKILFYICNEYKGTDVEDRAKKELLRLYGEKVFLEN